MISKDGLLNSLQLDILSREEFLEGEEAGLVLGFIVVAILDLALESSKLDSLVSGTGVGTVNDSISGLDKEQVQLYWVITINVLIRKEELLSEGEHDGLLNALLTE